jgi:hypothetical protein
MGLRIRRVSCEILWNSKHHTLELTGKMVAPFYRFPPLLRLGPTFDWLG